MSKLITFENYKNIKEFKDYVNWDKISVKQNLSEKFISEFKDYVNWNGISFNQKLSEEFIKKFKDSVNWNTISYRQKLTEKFIREFRDYINWNNISINQNLSEKFIREFKIENYDILNSIFYCGVKNKCIYIKKSKPLIINIGCFSGTKNEAIEAVSKRYNGKDKLDYIESINECFNI